MLEALKLDGCALEDATEALHADRAFVLQAVKQNGQAIQYAAGERCTESEFVLEAVKMDGCALEDAAEALHADRDVVLEAVKQHLEALQFYSLALRVALSVCLFDLLNRMWATRSY